MIEIFRSPKPWIDMTITIFLRVNEQRNILHEIRKQKANWIGHILCRNCLLNQVIEGKIKGQMEVTRRWGRRRRKPLDDLKDRRGYSYLKEEALDHTMWMNCFGGGFGPVVRQNTQWMKMYQKNFPYRGTVWGWNSSVSVIKSSCGCVIWHLDIIISQWMSVSQTQEKTQVRNIWPLTKINLKYFKSNYSCCFLLLTALMMKNGKYQASKNPGYEAQFTHTVSRKL